MSFVSTISSWPYRYPNNSIKAGEHGVEIKTTRKAGGAVDTHGARDQWMCVFVYAIDNESEPTSARRPLQFSEVYLGQVVVKDFGKIRAANSEQGRPLCTLKASPSSDEAGSIAPSRR